MHGQQNVKKKSVSSYQTIRHHFAKYFQIHHQRFENLKTYNTLVHWIMKVKTKVKDICKDSITEFGVTHSYLRYKTFNVTYIGVLHKIKIYSTTLLVKLFHSNPAKYLS